LDLEGSIPPRPRPSLLGVESGETILDFAIMNDLILKNTYRSKKY
jgi:hypothetical protein